MLQAVYFEYQKDYENFDLQTCVMEYKNTSSEFFLTAILYKLRGITNRIVNKYKHLDDCEVIAICEDKLLDALNSYDISKSTAKFSTYYHRCAENAVINYDKSLKHKHILSLDQSYDNGSEETDTMQNMIQDETNHISNTDTEILLHQLSKVLDSNEYKVCSTILKDTHRLTKAEIATELGLTKPAIADILKRLQKRFSQYDVCRSY